jgi:hypothetical protein
MVRDYFNIKMKESIVNKQPKIALCLSGLIRNSFFCFPYIYNSFLNSEYKVDVFIHTWNDSPTISLYNPLKYKIENETDVINQIRPQIPLDGVRIEGNVNNNIKMFYSIKKCFELVPDDYDVVIRCRFDLLLQDKINLKYWVDKILLNEFDLYIPTERFNMGGFNDQLAIGSYNAMKIYSDCAYYLHNLSKALNRWHPETFLHTYLNQYNLIIIQDDYEYRIVKNVNSISVHDPQTPFKYNNI